MSLTKKLSRATIMYRTIRHLSLVQLLFQSYRYLKPTSQVGKAFAGQFGTWRKPCVKSLEVNELLSNLAYISFDNQDVVVFENWSFNVETGRESGDEQDYLPYFSFHYGVFEPAPHGVSPASIARISSSDHCSGWRWHHTVSKRIISICVWLARRNIGFTLKATILVELMRCILFLERNVEHHIGANHVSNELRRDGNWSDGLKKRGSRDLRAAIRGEISRQFLSGHTTREAGFIRRN